MSIHVSRRRLVLFLFVSLFAVAQISWWIILQIRVGEDLRANQNLSWQQEIAAAKHCAETDGVEDVEQFRNWLSKIFPDLDYDETKKTIFVKESAIQKLEDYTSHIIRMIVYEGAFFTLIILLGLLYIYWTLQREAQVERHFSNFLASITHELKTPLTAMHLFVDALKIPDVKSEQVEEAHDSLTENLNRLDSLIDKLLQSHSRIVDKADKFVTADIGQETLNAVKSFSEIISGDIHSEITIDVKQNVFASVDIEQWRILVTNLIENAVKYSDADAQINVDVSSTTKSAVLTVTDSGIGFKKTEKNLIFKRFYRIGDENTRNSKGAGLGLYLVKEIAENLGGSVLAHSDGPGQGAVFTVRIPLTEKAIDG